MAQRKRPQNKSGTRRVSIRAVRRQQPDNVKLSRALINFALQQAADEAAAEAEDRRRRRETEHD